MSNPGKCPANHNPPSDTSSSCPVDHKAASSNSTWSRFIPFYSSNGVSNPVTSASLSTERQVSSIPKASDGNWVYPSEAQFFAAMARKNHNPLAADMKTVVPIHNAVNERAWTEVMKWETGRGGDKCGGVKLVNFKGRPGDRSLKARWKTLLGYSPPFDRHDWTVDRCGMRMRYIIDFYTGHSAEPVSSNLSFYLDVRPALDNWEGVKMRIERFWGNFFGSSSSTP